MAEGIKLIETRSWKVDYRGELAIHATKGFPDGAKRLAEMLWAQGRLPSPATLPLGAIVCVVKLVSIESTTTLAPKLGDLEKFLGDYAPGRYGWITSSCKKLTVPVPLRGFQGLFKLDPEAELLVRQQVTGL